MREFRSAALTRAAVGQRCGSLVNTTVGSPSYDFTGFTPGTLQVLFYVSAINANGRGPAVLAAVHPAVS